jgi:hypothetical protein
MARTGVPPGDRRPLSRGCLRDRRQGAGIMTGRREVPRNLDFPLTTPPEPSDHLVWCAPRPRCLSGTTKIRIRFRCYGKCRAPDQSRITISRGGVPSSRPHRLSGARL